MSETEININIFNLVDNAVMFGPKVAYNSFITYKYLIMYAISNAVAK